MARKHAPSNEPAEVDEIEALRRAIIQASEENWSAHAVPEAERSRLRPGVAALAKNATDRLRVEHAMRAGRAGRP